MWLPFTRPSTGELIRRHWDEEESEMSRTDLEWKGGLWTQAMLSSRIAAALQRKAEDVAPEEDDSVLLSKALDVLRNVQQGTEGLLTESAAAPRGEVVFIMPSAFRLIVAAVRALGKSEPKPGDILDYLRSVADAIRTESAPKEDYERAEAFFGQLSSALCSDLVPHPPTPGL